MKVEPQQEIKFVMVPHWLRHDMKETRPILCIGIIVSRYRSVLKHSRHSTTGHAAIVYIIDQKSMYA